jgi:hypothetical protein
MSWVIQFPSILIIKKIKFIPYKILNKNFINFFMMEYNEKVKSGSPDNRTLLN